MNIMAAEGKLQNQQRYAMEAGYVRKPSWTHHAVGELWVGAGSGWGSRGGKGSLKNSNFCQNSETWRGIQVQNGSFGQPRNSIGPTGLETGSTTLHLTLIYMVEAEGEEMGLLKRCSVRLQWQSTGIQVRNGSFYVSGNGLRADRGDSGRSNS